MTSQKMFRLDVLKFRQPFGMRIIESPHAMAHPKLREPLTDDMRAMVDDLRHRCPAPMQPAAYTMSGMIVAHPSLVREIRRGTVAVQSGCFS